VAMKVSFSRPAREEPMTYPMGYQVGSRIRKFIQRIDSPDFSFFNSEMKSFYGLVDVILFSDDLMNDPVGRMEL
jgi:hypothetical protein